MKQSSDNIRIDNEFQSLQEYSVSEISNKVKCILEDNFTLIKIKGEISGLTVASSGHAYFNLKEQNHIISATCWRFNFAHVKFKISEGLEVIVTGKMSSYSGQSKYQIIVERIEPFGQGAFLQILKERKEKLAKEGLLDPIHKKPLPLLPKIIGIVTSQTGSVIRDIIHRITERCGVHLIIWPVTVQGENAAAQVSAAIDGFNSLQENKPELLIVARGGGSIEDLWAFNEEIVARSAFASKIPLISAIGHETDYTILDLVADKRAPTPTAAAEFAVPVAKDMRAKLKYLQNNIISSLNQYITNQVNLLNRYHKVSTGFTGHLISCTQRVDMAAICLKPALVNMLHVKSSHLAKMMLSSKAIYNLLAIKHANINAHHLKICTQMSAKLKDMEYRLSLLSNNLKNADYRHILNKGYALIQKKDKNTYIKSVHDTCEKEEITIIMKDGKRGAIIN